ncbi:MAG: GspH/FimT family pseudopilin [Deltaproteobacteria bacterium]|nr:GspH/FimT family pseudopilin [Deltaproteobacteria bacterium]
MEMPNMRDRTSGFTLIELMIVIAIIAIMIVLAVPKTSNWIALNRYNGAARDILSTMRKARLVAVEENREVVLAFDPVNDTCRVFVDDGAGSGDLDLNGIPDNAGNFIQDGTERTVSNFTLPNDVDMTGAVFDGAMAFRFDRRGFPLSIPNPANLTDGLIRLRSSLGGIKQIDLLRSGHSRIQ